MLKLHLVFPSPLSSGYFNDAQFFNSDPHTDRDNAAGGMYMAINFNGEYYTLVGAQEWSS